MSSLLGAPRAPLRPHSLQPCIHWRSLTEVGVPSCDDVPLQYGAWA